jgi:hypothetical protein
MARYPHLRRPAVVAGLIVAGVIALSAVPAGSTIVCPSGIKPPSPYCTDMPPTATTKPASNVTATSATLNGIVGPGVAGGDPTQYFFEYGTTIPYSNQTPTQTLGSCPAGITPPSPYCTTLATQSVSANISNLTPCTDYNFRVVASNHDNRGQPTNGTNQTFTTGFAPPLTHVKSPKKVKARHKFKVKFTLKYDTTDVMIVIEKKNGTVVPGGSYDYGPLSAGKYQKTIKAPKKKGNYILQVIAKLSCGTQTVAKKLKVH